MYLDEMAVFLFDQFGLAVSLATVHRALEDVGWSRKAARKIAAQRCQELRDAHQLVIAEFEANQLVYMDESGCDERVGFRKMGWSPHRVTPEQIVSCERGQRVHILPAYTVNGVLTADVYTGFTDEERYGRWLEEQVLPLCGRYPAANSVLVMDNASFHRSERITEVCEAAGVRLVYLPPYSPDFNPIEEYFGQLKDTIRRHWHLWESGVHDEFEHFIADCVRISGSNRNAARGHFQNAYVEVGVGDVVTLPN
ncbi:Hypothetical protein D9617_85g015900 [Elsinoe fawcettii]|nr:Hypothetical protein D9617_85g015900 [Elsinoe fawcettii]